MEPSGDNPKKPDTGPSLTAIAALQELRQFAISQRKQPDKTIPEQTPHIITDMQLDTLVRSAGTLRGITIYAKRSGRKTEDGRTIHENKHGPFRITSIDDYGSQKRDPRLLIVAYDNGQSPAITLTLYSTLKKGHEFNLFVDFGEHPEIDLDEPLTYDSKRKKREKMHTAEYEVASDLLTRAEKVFIHRLT